MFFHFPFIIVDHSVGLHKFHFDFFELSFSLLCIAELLVFEFDFLLEFLYLFFHEVDLVFVAFSFRMEPGH